MGPRVAGTAKSTWRRSAGRPCRHAWQMPTRRNAGGIFLAFLPWSHGTEGHSRAVVHSRTKDRGSAPQGRPGSPARRNAGRASGGTPDRFLGSVRRGVPGAPGSPRSRAMPPAISDAQRATWDGGTRCRCWKVAKDRGKCLCKGRLRSLTRGNAGNAFARDAWQIPPLGPSDKESRPCSDAWPGTKDRRKCLTGTHAKSNVKESRKCLVGDACKFLGVV